VKDQEKGQVFESVNKYEVSNCNNVMMCICFVFIINKKLSQFPNAVEN